jgi:hypothetical protein
MQLRTSRVVVGVVASRLTSQIVGEERQGYRLHVRVLDGEPTIFLGGSGITTATGYPLAAGQEKVVDVTPTDDVFAISTADADVALLFEHN